MELKALDLHYHLLNVSQQRSRSLAVRWGLPDHCRPHRMIVDYQTYAKATSWCSRRLIYFDE